MGYLGRFVNNLSLKYKLSALIVPSLVVILLFSAQRVSENYAQVKQMAVIVEQTSLAMGVNSLVNELQKERGMTSVFVGSKGVKMGPEMDAQRKLVDKEMADFNKKLESFHEKGLEKKVKSAKEMLESLESNRNGASRLTLTVPEAVEFYTGLINKLIQIIGAMPLTISDGEIANHFMGFLVAQNYKEPMGIERATLAGAFANNKFAPGQFQNLLEALTHQSISQKLYYTIMSEDNVKPFEKFLYSDTVKKTLEMRKIAVSKAETGNFGVDANEWVKLQTEKINLFNNTVIKEKLQKDILEITDRKSKEAKSALAATAAIALTIIIVTAFISTYLTVGMLRTARGTTGVIGEIAKGDLTKEVLVEGTDEIGELGKAVNYHVQNLCVVLEGVNGLASSVHASANELAATVEEQASTTTEQSASLTEITATMEELSVSSSEIADSANSVAQLSKNMLSETDRTFESLRSLKEKMDEIETDNKNSISEILELDRKSKEIGKIMGLINNIADQTKMIAFNAAIEASSAGEAGKRFSVVAGEIRRLADNVMESTGEIQGKIDEIQKAVNRLVVVSEKGTRTVREGADFASASLNDLVNIVAGTKSSTESAVQISLSTQQQKTASNQVLSALKEIGQGLHQTSAAVRQTSAATSHMRDTANHLQKMLGKFKMSAKSAAA